MHVHKGKDSKRLLSAGASIKLMVYCVFVDNRLLCVQESFFFFFTLFTKVQCEHTHSTAWQVDKCYTLGQIGACVFFWKAEQFRPFS